MERKGGANKLAQVLQRRMSGVVNANIDNVCDFGTIQADMSLVTNLYPIPLPKGSYLVCRQLTVGKADSEFAETAVSGGGYSHSHKVKLPSSMSQLKAGDRVLVCWVQSDAVVIDVLGTLEG